MPIPLTTAPIIALTVSGDVLEAAQPMTTGPFIYEHHEVRVCSKQRNGRTHKSTCQIKKTSGIAQFINVAVASVHIPSAKSDVKTAAKPMGRNVHPIMVSIPPNMQNGQRRRCFMHR